jgi:hypothetical protein
MAVRDILGIYEDGSDRDIRLPSNVRIPLKMTQGSTLLVRLRVLTTAGVPVDLAASSATVYLTVKRHASNGAGDLAVTGELTPIFGVNRAAFTLQPSNTKFLTPGRYVYDVWMVHTGGRDALVPMSQFELEPAIQLP